MLKILDFYKNKAYYEVRSEILVPSSAKSG